MSYTVPLDGQLDNIYVTDAWLAEKYAGDFLWNWGANGSGQLGDNTITPRSSPVQIIGSGNTWKQISTGAGWRSGAIKTDGTLWMWGDNSGGSLGDNTIASKSSPVQTIAGGTNWKQVSVGGNATAAIKTDGTLWMWGANVYGELGDNTTTHRSSPVQTIAGGTNWKQVAAGSNFTTAIKTDGTLWCWGRNQYGEVGDNTTTPRSSPVQTIAGGTNWKSPLLNSGGGQTNAAIKTDGTLWMWGRNEWGQLGDNTITHRSSPVQTIAGGTNWKQSTASYTVAGAIKTDGTLWMWGANHSGSLGDNTQSSKSSPVQVFGGGANWKQVSVGGTTTAAIKSDGTLWVWGYNSDGQLGLGSQLNTSSPVQTIAGGANWKQVVCGSNCTSAITINNFNTTG